MIFDEVMCVVTLLRDLKILLGARPSMLLVSVVLCNNIYRNKQNLHLLDIKFDTILKLIRI